MSNVQIRLTGDGTVGGTRIYVIQGDTEIDITYQVTSVAIAHKAGDLPRVTLTLAGPREEASLAFDVLGQATLPKEPIHIPINQSPGHNPGDEGWVDPRVGQVLWQ